MNTQGSKEDVMAVEARELSQLARDHVWLHRAQWDGQIFVKGEGCRITDMEGNTYLDARAGYTVVNVGYGRQEIADAVADQMRNIVFVPGGSVTIPMIKLAAKLAQLAPGDLSRTIFSSGGSEANETALKMAKAYHNRSGSGKRYKVISRMGSYHGSTLGMMSAIPRRSNEYEPFAPGAIQVGAPDCYNCPYGKEYPSCDIQCAKEIEQRILWEGPESVSAFIGEPIAHSSGLVVPPKEYWPRVRDICDKYGVLLIADEVVNGFGRTGRMFASEHFDLEPDIMTVAKGLVSGYVPVSAAIANSEIAALFVGEGVEPFNHVFSFGGLPASCAAALANIDIIESENLVERSNVLGEHLFQRMQSLYAHSIVGDVRGIGLEAGAFLVKDRQTKEPFGKEEQLGSRFSKKCLERGLVCGMLGNSVGVTPPLCVNKDDIDEMVSIIDGVLTELDEELRS